MKNAIVKLGFCILFFCAANSALAGIPGVTVTRITSSPTNAASIEFDVQFTEDVSGFATGDATLSGAGAAGATGAIAAVGGSASHYKITVTGHTANGPINVDIAAGVATAVAAGNDPNTASAQVTTVFDNVKPGVTITHPGQADPTTGGSLAIKFTVEFTEDVTGFDASKMSFAGSGGGLGTLTFGTITEITTNRKWEVMVNVPVTATGNLDVLLSVPAGGVSDAAGNTNNASSGGDNQVTYAGTFPTFSTPTAVSTHNSFTISSNILTSGGRAITERGTVWSTTTPVGASDHSNDEGSGTGAFDHTRSMSVTSHTKYYFATYAINAAVGKVLSSEGTVWTLDDPATADGNVSAAVASSGTTVNLTFTAFGATADGLVIIAKPGGSAVTSGEMLQGQDPTDQPYYITTITSSAQTTFSVTGLTPGNTYTFSAIPFTVFGAQEETTNYRTGSFTSKTETTLVALSRIVENAAPAATLAYETKQGMTITNASHGLSIADLKLVDGNAPANDSDNFATELATLTIHVDNHQFVDHVAINDNGSIHAEGTLDASGNITFTLDPGDLVAADNDDNGDQFNIIANFKAVVDDGAVIKVTVTGATVIASSSGLINASAGGYTTGNTANAIAVVASTIEFTGVPASVNVNATWGFTATLKDALGNIDTNQGGNLELSSTGLGPVAELDKPLVNGVVTWSNSLAFSSAGSPKTVNVNATNWPGSPNGSFTITSASLGVAILFNGNPANGTEVQNICFGDASQTASDSYTTLNPITIQESDVADFAVGNNQTFALALPTGFIFDKNVAPTFGAPGTELTGLAWLNFSTAGDIVRITYNITGTTNLNKIVLNGLKVKYIGTTPVSNAEIRRLGGSADQKKNDDIDERSHGKLSTISGDVAANFVVIAAGFNEAETRFSKSGSGLITLQGRDNANLAINGTFTGPGVALDSDGKYKFNPAGLAAPGLYDITFISDPTPTAPYCRSVVSKKFEVYASTINGLNEDYCIYEAPAVLTGYSNFNGGGICTVQDIFGSTFPFYVADAYVQYPTNGSQGDPYLWKNNFGSVFTIGKTMPADNYQFNPGAAVYSTTIDALGHVEVGYRKKNNCVAAIQTALPGGFYTGLPGPDQFVFGKVNVHKRPIIDFTPNLGPNLGGTNTGICATGADIPLKSDQLDKNEVFDDMWASLFNDAGNEQPGVTGDRTSGFRFDPKLINPSAASDLHVQINFQHRDKNTQCTNTISHDFWVWKRPALVLASNIIANGPSGDQAEFCERENVRSFQITPLATIGKNFQWYDDNNVFLAGGSVFSPIDFLDKQPGGEPEIEKTNFNVTQIEHRVPGFDGCESNKKQISVEIFKAPTQSAGSTVFICAGNDLILSTLNATLKEPDNTNFNGTWLKANPAFPSNDFKDAGNNVNNRFLSAVRYEPSADEYAAGKVELQLLPDDPAGPCKADDKLFVTIPVNPGASVTFPSPVVPYCANEKDMDVDVKVVGTDDFTWSVAAASGQIRSTYEKKATTIFDAATSVLTSGGVVTLTVTTADPDDTGPCSSAIGTVDVRVDQLPLVTAVADFSICSEATAIDFDLVATKPLNSSAAIYSWAQISGPGTFGTITNPTALTTNYDPSDGDEDPGLVTVETNRVLVFEISALPDVMANPNECGAQTDQLVVTIHGRPIAPTPKVVDPYCQGTTINELTTDALNPKWYTSITGVPSPISQSRNYQPSIDKNIVQQTPYWLSETFSGCESDYAQTIITINPVPQPDFTLANQCFGDIMQFTDNSTIAQPSFGGPRSIVSWNWDFDDEFQQTGEGTGPITNDQGGTTSGTFENPGHRYTKTGLYEPALTLRSSDNCLATFVHPIRKVGPVPVTRFTAAKLCDEDETEFTSTSGLPAGETAFYLWDFDDAASGSNSATIANPKHKFTGVDGYNVTLTISTDLGCDSTFVSRTSIFPYIKSDSQFPYIENFESGNHGWVAEGKVTTGSTVTPITSWNQLTTAGSIPSDPMEGAGPTFWATHTVVDGEKFYHDNERSVLYGPCVDLNNLERPVLAVDYFSDTENQGDGAYVEYLDESIPGQVWKPLGSLNGGLDWYKSSSVGGLSLLGDIGQTLGQFGWSGTSTDWTTGRFNLDPFATKSRIRFRIVFGSNISPVNTDTYDGFAIDNFKLETRNRLVLVENFTSKSSATSVTGNTAAFQSFPSVGASDEVVKIEYHVGIPASSGDPQDPIFLQNPMDPNARASFYGISAVPRAYIDGYTNLNGGGAFNSLPNWTTPFYNEQSLKTSPIEIAIDNPSVVNGVIRIKGKVTAKDTDLAANKYSLYVAVVEKQVGTDAFVLRKMLPSASGSKVPFTARGSFFEFDESWSLDKTALGTAPELVAVAFVQSDILTTNGDRKQREVLQAAFNDNPDPLTFTTGLEIPFLEQTALYPNPADRLVTIELPQATDSGVEVRIMDQLGRQVGTSSIRVGQRSTSIDTRDWAGAMYIVQLKERGVNTTKKLVITHRH